MYRMTIDGTDVREIFDSWDDMTAYAWNHCIDEFCAEACLDGQVIRQKGAPDHFWAVGVWYHRVGWDGWEEGRLKDKIYNYDF